MFHRNLVFRQDWPIFWSVLSQQHKGRWISFFANKKITDTIFVHFFFFEDKIKLKNKSWDLSTFEDYDGSTNHDIFMHRCILKSDQELRISARLNWTLGLNNWKKADFLLKSDPKLGGVLMYNTSSSGKITVSITVVIR